MGQSLGCSGPPGDTPKCAGNKAVICVHGMASSALEQEYSSDFFGASKYKLIYLNMAALSANPAKTLETLKLKVTDGVLHNGQPVKTTTPFNDKNQRPVPGMAGMSTLNPGGAKPIAIWEGLVEHYQDEYNLHAYNYDWRRWGDEVYMEEAVDRFEEEVTDGIAQSGHPSSKASLIGHSMGCPLILHCLSTLGDAWVKEHIDNVILLAPALGGSPSMLPSYAHAPYLATTPLSKYLSDYVTHSLGDVCSSWPCMLAEMPLPVGDAKGWPDDFIFAYAPKKHYKLADMGAFIKDVASCTKNRELGPLLWPGIEKMAKAMRCPPVPVTMIYSSGLPTPEVLRYPTRNLSLPPKVQKTTPGDGTICSSSLVRIGEAWKKAGNKVNLLECPGSVAHSAVIVAPFTLGWLPNLVNGLQNWQYIEVTVIEAKNLRNADWTSSSDPYVCVSIPGKSCSEVFSGVINDNVNPTWNWRVDMWAWAPGDDVKFQVYDQDPAQKYGDMLGWAILEISDFEEGPCIAEMELEDGQGSLFAKVEIKMLEK